MRQNWAFHGRALTDSCRKHGTFRPALMGLVKSNPADLVKGATAEAFAAYAETSDAMGALKILTKLRGIGPATASLLLNVFSPAEVPFFSDELFRWTHWDGKGKTGWGRSIKYNVTEYKELLASVEALRKRLGVRAVDAEKVAYVLGKENVDIDVDFEGGDDEAGDEEVRDKIVGNKIKGNTEGDREIAEVSAQAVANMDGEKTQEDFLTGSFKEHDKRRKTADQKTTEMERKPELLKENKEVSKGDVKEMGKKGTKRKAQEKAPAEGTRKNTRRKA